MEPEERTQDLYEVLPGYAKPPLVPLPSRSKMANDLGIKPTRLSSWVAEGAMAATGFRSFHDQLPERIEPLLRRTNLRGPALFAPVVAATLALEQDPKSSDPFTRAATLLLAARDFAADVEQGRLEAERCHGREVEMGQFPNLFSTGIVFEDGRPRVFKSRNRSRILVALGGRQFVLELGPLEEDASLSRTVRSLRTVVRKAQESEDPISYPGLLTCAKQRNQHRFFGQIQDVPCNRESLSILRHSFLTLCLELEASPESTADAALAAHSGNFSNRWFHSSLQLIVFGNSRACVLCNGTVYVDGNTMMRGAAEIQKRATAISSRARPTDSVSETTVVPSFEATELRWQIPGEYLEQARRDLDSVVDPQQATFEIHSVGEEFFLNHRLKPVPTFILALQMTARRLTGRHPAIRQFLTMSRYRCMGLLLTRVSTQAVQDFVDYLDRPSQELNREHALELLSEATKSQLEACRRARRHLPSFTILRLFMASVSRPRRKLATGVTAVAGALLRLLGLEKPLPPDQEIVVSHPAIYPQVPIVGRPGIRLGKIKYFGLHYQIFPRKIVITLMPATSWGISNRDLIVRLEKDLGRIRNLVAPSGRLS